MSKKSNPQIVSELYKQLTSEARPVGRRLIILCGIPYSGKSTVADTLLEEGFAHIWVTVIKKTYGVQDRAALDIAKQLIQVLLENEYRVTFDFTSHTIELRSQFMAIAKSARAPYKIVWLNTDEEELYCRQAEAKAQGGDIGRSVIPARVIDEFMEELKVPRGGSVLEVKNGSTQLLDVWLDTLD